MDKDLSSSFHCNFVFIPGLNIVFYHDVLFSVAY